MLIGNFVLTELSVNQNIRNVDQHYLLKSQWEKEGMGIDFCTLAPLAQSLKREYPQLIANAYTYDAITSVVKKDAAISRESLQIGDADVVNMYGFKLLAGNPATALTEPYTLVIPEKTAYKYFGKTDDLDEFLEIESFSGETQNFRITGVLAKQPFNSITDMQSDVPPLLLSKESLRFFGRYESYDNWNNAYLVSWVELHNGVTVADLKQPIDQILKTNASETYYANLNVVPESLGSIYLTDNSRSVQKNLQILILIAGFILLMALANFINISISNSSGRIREVGVRKSLGGKKYQVIFLFLSESVILAFASLVCSLFLYEFTKPFFESIVGKEIPSLWKSSMPFLVSLPILTFFLGLIAGIYPAISIASLQTLNSLKGKFHALSAQNYLRKGLLTLQFALAIFVVAASVFVSQQVNFIFNKDLGFDKSQIIHLETPRNWSEAGVYHMLQLRDEITQLADVENGSLSYEIPNGNAGNTSGIYLNEKDSTSAIYGKILKTDSKYAKTYGMDLIQGTYFNNQSSLGDILINETAAKNLGLVNMEEAIHKQVLLQAFGTVQRIVGVVKDFNFGSIHEAVGPIVISNVKAGNYYRFLSFKIAGGDVPKTISKIEGVWKSSLPNAPFVFNFMDDTINKLYATETRLKEAAHLATIISLVIVLIGILGIVSLSISKRTKEISIRRILGASMRSTNWLFLKEFIFLKLAALLIAIPLTYYLISLWLQNYAYHIVIKPATFAFVALLFALLVTVIVGIQVFLANRTNPVEHLRSE
ncbi:MAG: putative ABC transport system permease protein [Arcticibacterium sp.]|jgi:putative ABC transport system permease protein